MSERDDAGHKPGRQPAEGVRIIKAEEAQAALEAGEAAGRRPDDQLRFGDVPPAPTGPRPAHRFPLPDSVNPAEAVSLPPLAPRRLTEGRRGGESRRLEEPPAALPVDEVPEPEPVEGESRAYDPGAAGPAAPSARYEPVPPPPPGAPAPVSRHEPPPPPAPAAPRAGYEPPPPPPPAPEAPAARYVPPAPRRAADPNPIGGQDQVEADAPPWAASSGWHPSATDRTTEMGVQQSPGIPEEGITLSGAPHEMPHWSDPPTGEVPRLRFDDDEVGEGAGDDMEAWRALGSRGVRWRDEDDWEDAGELSDLVSDDKPIGALDQNRTEHSDIYSFDEDFERVRTSRSGSHPVVDLTGVEDDYGDPGEAEWARAEAGRPRPGSRAGRGSRSSDRGRAGRGGGGALRRDARPGVPSSSTGGAAAAAAGVAAGGAGATAGAAAGAVGGGASGATRRRYAATATADRPARPTRPDRTVRRPSAPVSGGGDVGNRVAVGVGLIVLLAICYVIGPKALVALATVAVVASAAEAYNMTRAPGFRPATLLGLVATVGCVLGAYWKGLGAIPVVTVLLFGGVMLWYVLGVVEARPLANVAVTVMVFVWVAVLGSFSAVMLRESHGQGLFLGAVLVAVAADVFAFLVGRWIGSRPLAPHISPHKTVEGFIGGIVGALIVGAIIGKTVHPWSGMRYGLILGLVVGLIAPAGDLFESMLKRDLGIKDSGSLLGGHGGLLDRFDGILLALPAAYFVAAIAQLH